MSAVVFGAKAGLAVMLLVAGGAKAADPASFAATVRMFLPLSALRYQSWFIALAIACAEVTVGVSSLAVPGAAWINLIVLGLAAAFVIVDVSGYLLYRGRSCQCFGALSRRKFNLAGIVRSVLVAGAALLVTLAAQHWERVGLPDAVLLASAGVVISVVAYTAARTLRTVRFTAPQELPVIT